MTDNQMKLAAAVAGYAIWGFFAYTGHTDIPSFIQAIQAGLVALGAYHAHTATLARMDSKSQPGA
jgi:hypothetical protein